MREEGSAGVSSSINTDLSKGTQDMLFHVAKLFSPTWRLRFPVETFRWPTLLTYTWSETWGSKAYINGSLRYQSNTVDEIVTKANNDSHLILGGQTSSFKAEYKSFQMQDLTIWEMQLSSLAIKRRFESGNEFITSTNLWFVIRHIHIWRTRKKTMGPSAWKRGLWGIVALFSFVFLPNKSRLHALGLTVLRLSAIYEYGVYEEQTNQK